MQITTNLTKAVQVLKRGGLVAFPTETVYGLGADANSLSAVKKVFAVKKRPLNHPLIVHVSNLLMLSQFADRIPSTVYALAQAFWPGPLTLILPKKSHVLDLVTGGQVSIALRIPNHPLSLELIEAFGSGIVGPSANPFMRLSPTTSAGVASGLGDEVDLILEGGAAEVGLESTILDLTKEMPTILRHGMIKPSELEMVLKTPVLLSASEAVIAPGVHKLHYAPKTNTRVLDRETIIRSVFKPRAAILTYSGIPADQHRHVVAMSNDPRLYAHDLYETLRQLDQGYYQEIIIEAVPAIEAWLAIADRIKKAGGSIK